ncbi:MAG TPA: biotin carboxyl carrier domain-containing protein [Armatimonadetes bacterium]|nr:biotin carboxyl carrier domain-containing protein [Armatimonadota bacterium]
MRFEDDDIRWLLDSLSENGLQEIEVKQGDLRVRVSAVAPAAVGPQTLIPSAMTTQPVMPVQPQAAPAAPAAPAGVPVLSPMAGIFYRRPSPEEDAFCEEGDRVEAGQVVGLIEVMKLFNEITAPVSGVISKFVSENQDRVEADQPLLYISPASQKE